MCAGSGLLIFDDACGFCRGSVRLLHWLDWFNTVEPLPLSAAGECMKRHSISHDAMTTSMHLVTRDGRVFAGAEAIREFGLRMPLLFPIALVLRLGFALRLAKRFPHVIVSRTFSKAYSLCFQRVGYFVGHPALISALDRIRDSYNVNGLGQAAALATLSDTRYYREQFRRIVRLREETAAALEACLLYTSPSPRDATLSRMASSA